MKQRDEFIDVAKGLCILFVVTIHTELFGAIGTPYPVLAVPFFFFMSGFYDRPRLGFVEFLKKNWNRLLLPTLLWMVIAYIHKSILYYLGHGGFQFSISWTDPMFANGVAWFIIALFYAKLIIWGLSRLRLPVILEGVLIFVFGWLGCMHEMPLLLDEGLSALPLYYIGKILYPLIPKLIGNRFFLILGAVAFASVTLREYPYVLVPMRDADKIMLYPIIIVIAILSFVFFLQIAYKLRNIKWLSLYGQHTFGILLTHCMFLHTFAVVINRVFPRDSALWIIAFSLAFLFTCWASFVISKLCEVYVPLLIGKKRR